MDLATVDKLLTTTRTVRKRLDLTRPVDFATIQQCIELAIQAPSGGNNMRYHFMVVVDPAQRTRLATIYRKAYFDYYLPRRQAQAIALFYLDDRPVSEIARMLECSESTARTHLSRGRSALASRLGVDE